MDNYKLIGSLKTYAQSLNWAFLYGNNFYQNYEASQNEYVNGQLVLAVDFGATPKIINGKTVEITYTGIMMLGRKFDNDGTVAVEDDEETSEDETVEVTNDATPSNLDETQYQKYTRRLEELMQLLGLHAGLFACANELKITQCQMRMDMNKFDTNIDFVAANVTLVQ